MRLGVLFWAVAVTAAEPWSFPGQPRVYQAEVEQEVSWVSMGDTLRFTSGSTWRFLVQGRPGTATEAEFSALVLRVTGFHRGPGWDESVDSAQRSAAAAPLLGHLQAAEGVVLSVRVERATGRVIEVRGGETLVQRIGERSRDPADPSAPGMLAGAAGELYGRDRLIAWWRQSLDPPVDGSLTLTAPLHGEAAVTWTGNRGQIRLPRGATAVPVLLARDPAPVQGWMEEVRGELTTVPASDGWLGQRSGEMSFRLVLDANTQPVASAHVVRWRFAPPR